MTETTETTVTTKTELQKHLRRLGACEEAREWAGERTPDETWDQCERADWLLWWAGRTEVNGRVAIVRAAAACARSVLYLVPEGEDRPRLAIEAAERWADSPTRENAYAAANAADAADAAANAANAANAYAYAAAANAANAANAYAYAYAAAANAANAANAYAYAAAAARAKKHKELCQIIRGILVCPYTTPTNTDK